MVLKDSSYIFSIVKQGEPPWTLVDCMKADNSTAALQFLPKCHGKYGAAVDSTLLAMEYLKWNISFVWSNSWNGAVGEVMRHEIDSCVPQVTPNFNRIQLVDFAGYMFMEQKICFTFCNSNDYAVLFQLSKLFNDPWLIFGLCLLSVFAIGGTFHILNYKGTHRTVFSKACSAMLETCTGILTSHRSLNQKEKFLQACFGLLSLLLLHGIIRSELMSSFVVKLPFPFSSVCDLAQKMELGELSILFLLPGDILLAHLKRNYGCFREAVEKNPKSVLYVSDGHGIQDVVQNPKVVSYRFTPFSKWQLDSYVRTINILNFACMIDHLCAETGLPDGFIVAKDKPELYEDLFRATWHLRQFGFIAQIEKYYHMEEEQEYTKRSVTRKPNYLSSVMKLYGLGVLCCVVVFAIELASVDFWLRYAMFKIVSLFTKF